MRRLLGRSATGTGVLSAMHRQPYREPGSPSRDSGESSEEGRAFLQARVALFWKLWFFLGLLSGCLSLVGAVAEATTSLWFDLAGTAQAGLWWALCRRGQRSRRFSRALEAGGLLVQVTLASFMMRYILGSFSDAHPVSSAEGLIMTDGYVSMMLFGGVTMMAAMRAALIPSRPRRTIIVTLLIGICVGTVSAAFVPTAGGGLAWRELDSLAYPLLPLNGALMWGFVIILCTVISSVTYGLRAEVREARQLGQYVLEHKIGEGGMGEVYRARHGMMRRPSAIKLLKSDRVGENSLRRFEREVQLTARLSHPNTITIYDYGRTDDGIFYYAMELLDGATVRRIVAVDGAQPAARVVRVLSMICGALAEAHEIGLIHRDIKPANIILCAQGGEFDVVKVLDFGLVKELDVDRDVSLTAANTITGTPQYLAPESIRDPNSVDARADIYALGAMAYYMLTGTDVFDGQSVVEVCGQHLHQEPEPPSSRGVEIPADLEAVVLACLAKEPAQRPQTAAELRRRIELCDVTPWDSARASVWWREHRAELDGAPEQSPLEGKTLAIDADRAVG